VWGALTSASESVPQRLRYAGYWYDQELGWYWGSVRMYDPSLKRWLQPDPSQTEGVGTYVYAGDDPVDETDPIGLQGGAAVAAGAGAGVVCAGTFYIPILGEIDCATAIAILGAAAVTSLFAAQQRAIPVPNATTQTRNNSGESAIRVQFQVSVSPAPGRGTTRYTESELAFAPNTYPGVTKAQVVAALNALYLKQQTARAYSSRREMAVWHRLVQQVQARILRASYITGIAGNIRPLQGGPTEVRGEFFRVDVELERGGAFGE
jgi:RHS repeat-associated protein